MWYCMGLVLLEVYCTLFCYCVIVYTISNMWWCMYWLVSVLLHIYGIVYEVFAICDIDVVLHMRYLCACVVVCGHSFYSPVCVVL